MAFTSRIVAGGGPDDFCFVAGLGVAAVGLLALVTGATGRCPGYVPFGISTVRESQVQPPIDRGKQAA